jgi:alpha-mannosidase
LSLVAVDDRSDTWSHGEAGFRQEIGRFGRSGAAAVDETGPVRAAVRTHSQWRNSEAVHWIRLYRDVPVIEGELRLFWRERLCALKLALPTRLVAVEATYEAPYGFVRRPANGEEQPGQQWADITGQLALPAGRKQRYGLARANDSRYGYDALDGELRMTVARSPAFAHHDPRRLEDGVEYRFMDQGEHVIRYRLIPHEDGWEEADVPKRAMELNVVPVWVNEYAHEGPLPTTLSFLSAEPANVMALVCKRSEDGEDLIIRCVETCGRDTVATISMPTIGLSWGSTFAPLQLRTFRIQRSPLTTVRETDGLEQPVGPPLALAAV